MSDLQTQLREAREAAGLSAREAASLVDVAHVERWEWCITFQPFIDA